MDTSVGWEVIISPDTRQHIAATLADPCGEDATATKPAPGRFDWRLCSRHRPLGEAPLNST